jgi:drug/metabolite transporter (DMT)-like permease
MMLTFYRGSVLTHNPSPGGTASSSSTAGGEHGTVRWVLGSVSMLANVVGFAVWLLLQRKFTRKYPAVYSATAFMSLFSFVQAGALALSVHRSSISVWALRGRIEIVAVVYCVRPLAACTTLSALICIPTRGRIWFCVDVWSFVCQGVVASGVGYLLLTYCVEKRGPLFTSAFSPLSQIFVACIDLFILHRPLYLGRSANKLLSSSALSSP